MKSIRLFLAISFVSVALAGLVRADEKDKAPKPDTCCCCGQVKPANSEKKGCASPKDCCCCTGKSGQVEKVMPKSSYNRKS